MVTFTGMSDQQPRQRSTDIFGQRYGEVLLVQAGPTGPHATVYNSFPLNDCPAELWSTLDARTVAAEHDATVALLNGPRFWLMDRIEKAPQGAPRITTFGGIDMIEQATVELSSVNPAPYSVNTVRRRSVFVFNAGRQIYQLTDPDGRHWVMQSWSQSVDPTLTLADLPGLAQRLRLPAGWSYRPRTLTAALRVDTLSRDAQVLQDDLANSYSLETG